jgi:hypothetical protein
MITALITVAADGTISGHAPREVLPGDHEAAIIAGPTTIRRRSVRDMPRHDLPWDGSISLRREDMYDENGTLR